MFTSQPIGFVSSPYTDTKEIPKGLGAKHDTDGVLKILPEFERGLNSTSRLFASLRHLGVRSLSQGAIAGGRFAGFAAIRQSAAWGVCDTVSTASERDWLDRRRAASPRWRRVACRGVDMLDGQLFSISNRICRASRPKGCAEGGWPKLRRDIGDDLRLRQNPRPSKSLDGAPREFGSSSCWVSSRLNRRSASLELVRCRRAKIPRFRPVLAAQFHLETRAADQFASRAFIHGEETAANPVPAVVAVGVVDAHQDFHLGLSPEARAVGRAQSDAGIKSQCRCTCHCCR